MCSFLGIKYDLIIAELSSNSSRSIYRKKIKCNVLNCFAILQVLP